MVPKSLATLCADTIDFCMQTLSQLILTCSGKFSEDQILEIHHS